MIIWQVGDSLINDVVQTFATEKGLEVINSATQNAIEEEVWVEQGNDERIRRGIEDSLLIILFLPRNYDSENTIVQLKRNIQKKQKHIIGLVYPYNDHVVDGFQHDREENVSYAVLTSLDSEHILQFLRDWYNAITNTSGDD